MLTSDFRYTLPTTSIAQEAVEPRDAARLLDTRDLGDHRFSDLPGLLREGDLVVVNDTRVRRARLRGRRPTGGAVELLVLSPVGDGRWEALARPARRLRAGVEIEVGESVVVVEGDPIDGRVVLRPLSGALELEMERSGEMPLPPYFTGRLEDPERYQTVYARRPGSAAAPTAGLHFTAEVISDLSDRGIALASVELEVGLDTFRPISEERVDAHPMHCERLVVGESTVTAVEEARRRGGRVVAVGTTVVRALESAVTDGVLRPMEGKTDLFIRPGHRFCVVDLMVTNFHVPGSTLVVLMAAFMGDRWRRAYEVALNRGYRFLSFGDAMLAERSP